MMCDCLSKISSGYKFNHYDESRDYIFSIFDDFGYMIYKKSDGVVERVLAHRHLGIYSHIHRYKYEKIPAGWELVEFEIDNNVIPEIKKLSESY